MQSVVLVTTSPEGVTFSQEPASVCETYTFSHANEGVRIYHDMDTATHVNVVNGRLCGCRVVVANGGSLVDTPRLWSEWTTPPREMPPPLSHTMSNMQMSTGSITRRNPRKVVKEEEPPVADIPDEDEEDEEDEVSFDEDGYKGADIIPE